MRTAPGIDSWIPYPFPYPCSCPTMSELSSNTFMAAKSAQIESQSMQHATAGVAAAAQN